MNVDQIIDLARDEKWDAIDDHLSNDATIRALAGWAKSSGLTDDDPNVLDLACSVFENTQDIDTATMNRLAQVTKNNDPDFVYARFRAACALFRHGDRKKETITALLDLTRDEEVEVRDVANGYLADLSDSELDSYFSGINFVHEHGFDEPESRYEKHFHEKTILKTIEGSLDITVNGIDYTLNKNVFIVVNEEEEHEAKVGAKGWKYTVAYNPNDQKKYPGVHD